MKAVDADGDVISYIIDPSSVRITPATCCLTMSCSSLLSHLSSACLQQDAQFFRIDLPNTGKVVLNKPLDYETRTHLQLIMWAQVTFRQVIHPGNQGEVRGFILLRSHVKPLHSNQQKLFNKKTNPVISDHQIITEK